MPLSSSAKADKGDIEHTKILYLLLSRFFANDTAIFSVPPISKLVIRSIIFVFFIFYSCKSAMIGYMWNLIVTSKLYGIVNQSCYFITHFGTFYYHIQKPMLK